jgi:hypothetical protein
MWHLDRERQAGRQVRAFIAEHEAPPGTGAPAPAKSFVEWTSGLGIAPSEGHQRVLDDVHDTRWCGFEPAHVS